MLATLLGDRRTTLSTVQRALRVYDAVRRPFALRVQEASRENGILYTLNYPGLTFDRPVPPVSSVPSVPQSPSHPRQQGHPGHPGQRGRTESEDAAEKLREIRTRVRANWEWAWKTTIDADLGRALRMLDDPAGLPRS